MSYRVFLLRRARKGLAAIPRPHQDRVRAAVRGLDLDPRPAGFVNLTDRSGGRVRVGVYRILYEIDEAAGEVTVLNIAHRRDAYR